MLDTIPVPADSKFGAMVARRLNASRPIAPAGSLAMSGPTGTGFAAPPTNLRDRRGLSAPSPRQFTLRAEVETKQDEPEQKRLVVKMCDFCDDAVRWNHVNIPQGGTISELDNGFREIYVGDWSDELSESKTFYLNLKIEFDAEGGWTTGHPFITSFSEWTVEDEPLEEKFEIGASRMFASFPIGHVLAGATGAFVRQCFDGSQNFVDLTWWHDQSSGGGSEGGEDPDEPSEDILNWISANVVTSLNGSKGDLVLSLRDGWLDILKNGSLTSDGLVGWVTESVSGLFGNMAVIGGNKIRVETEGNSLRISYDEGKTEDDVNPYPPEAETCAHPGEVPGGGAGGVGGGVAGDNRGDDGKAGSDCCGGSSGSGAGVSGGKSSPGVSNAPDKKGAETGTVITKDGDGKTTTKTSSPGKKMTTGLNQAVGGRRITDIDAHSMNGPAIKGKKVGEGDIRKIHNGSARSMTDDAKARVGGRTDIHKQIFYN